MSTLAFDTHKAIKVPKDAGFKETQAEATVSTIGETIGESVAAKEHITAGISYFTAEIAAFEARLYRYLWLMAAGIVGVTVTLVKLIPWSRRRCHFLFRKLIVGKYAR